MAFSRKALCALYALIAGLALVATWGNNVAYLPLGFVGATRTFWGATLANPASRSITADLLFLVLAVAVWMVLEARRLGLRGVWVYLVLGMLVAVSATVPLFLLHRERALAAREPGSAAGTLHPLDAAGLIVVAVGAIGYGIGTLMP